MRLPAVSSHAGWKAALGRKGWKTRLPMASAVLRWRSRRSACGAWPPPGPRTSKSASRLCSASFSAVKGTAGEASRLRPPPAEVPDGDPDDEQDQGVDQWRHEGWQLRLTVGDREAQQADGPGVAARGVEELVERVVGHRPAVRAGDFDGLVLKWVGPVRADRALARVRAGQKELLGDRVVDRLVYIRHLGQGLGDLAVAQAPGQRVGDAGIGAADHRLAVGRVDGEACRTAGHTNRPGMEQLEGAGVERVDLVLL